jgi:hypothetical protein
MRLEIEDKFDAAEDSDECLAALKLPTKRPAELAGRQSASVAASLTRLKAARAPKGESRSERATPLVTDADGGGYELPHVRRILEIRLRDRGYKHDEGGGRNSDPIPGRNSNGHGVGNAVGTPPVSSLSPTTPISSSSPPHTSAGAKADSDSDEDLNRKIRSFVGKHPGLTWSPRVEAGIRTLVASGGWNGMVSCIDEAVSRAVAEPVSYAVKVMAGRQAQARLKSEKRPEPKRLTGAKVYNV